MKEVVRVYWRGVESSRTKTEVFQAVKMPLEAPSEFKEEKLVECIPGRKVAALKWLMPDSLVSWRQITKGGSRG